MLLKGRPYTEQKTDTSNLPKLREVRRSLLPPNPIDSAKHRAKLRRQFQTRPISQKLAPPKTAKPQISRGPYRVNGYDLGSGLWSVTSTQNPAIAFLAESIKTGTVGVGDSVRGYHVYGEPFGFIEPKPQGRRFRFIESQIAIPPEEVETVEFDIRIAFTGRII